MAEKFTDILTYLLSLALAIAVFAFAAYKVNALNHMKDPPANMGLNFPEPKRKVLMEGPGNDDSLTTQSLGRASRWPAGTDSGPYSYELLTVVDGVAFVAVDSAAAKTLVPASVGTSLPGGIEVSAITRRDGRWMLSAGPLTLAQKLPQ